MSALLRAIAAGTFAAEDFADSTIQNAIKDGLIDWDGDRVRLVNGKWQSGFRLTTQGEAELADDDRPGDPRDRLEDV